jgi:anti-sigma factor RsiW
MKCTDKTIKDLLPAYLEQGLDQEEKLRVENHLGSCEDCRSELSLLRTMSGDVVPDPGEAFWAAMPDRVRRAVQAQKPRRKIFDLARIGTWMTAPRWALATAAVGIVVAASWLFVRPPAMDLARSAVPEENETLSDNGITALSINMEELSSTELAAATQWAQNELAPIREAISEDASENPEQDISEELSDLSPRELDRVLEMLKQKEQDAREKLRGNKLKEKNLG